MYIRDGKEVSRSAFWNMLYIDIADPDTNDVNKRDIENARQMLVDGTIIHVGRSAAEMHDYQLATTP